MKNNFIPVYFDNRFSMWTKIVLISMALIFTNIDINIFFPLGIMFSHAEISNFWFFIVFIQNLILPLKFALYESLRLHLSHYCNRKTHSNKGISEYSRLTNESRHLEAFFELVRTFCSWWRAPSFPGIGMVILHPF